MYKIKKFNLNAYSYRDLENDFGIKLPEEYLSLKNIEDTTIPDELLNWGRSTTGVMTTINPSSIRIDLLSSTELNDQRISKLISDYGLTNSLSYNFDKLEWDTENVKESILESIRNNISSLTERLTSGTDPNINNSINIQIDNNSNYLDIIEKYM